jgi:aconitate hydratase
MRLSGHSEDEIALTESYARKQLMFRDAQTPEAGYSTVIELDMGSIEPCIAGPRRPQDRVLLKTAQSDFAKALDEIRQESNIQNQPVQTEINGEQVTLDDGSIVIAAITSCTNTSNPSVMIGAGLLAKKAYEKGLRVKPWVKTSLAPGSRVVTDYLESADLLEPMQQMGFHVVGYGCTTCIGNSGPLLQPVSKAIREGNLSACAVLSGNRNFEGRIHAEVRMNYLASPPLVVAYAITGSMKTDLVNDALGTDSDGNPVYLKDIWPSQAEIHDTIHNTVSEQGYRKAYQEVFKGDKRWQALASPEGQLYAWDADSTYIRKPPYFDGMKKDPDAVAEIRDARVLVLLGDSVTTDHISPAGAIKADTPAGQYLASKGILPGDFNSLGSRRGNHEVMMRGTFANIRLRNKLAPGTEGGITAHFPDDEQMSIFDASEKYRSESVPLIIIAGKEYGSGSSRDWAAKGPMLLGVRAVIAESYERIHRSNLIGMGILPLEFMPGENAGSVGVNGSERYAIDAVTSETVESVTVTAISDSGEKATFRVRVRIDTPQEYEYYRHGGIRHYVLRQLAA